MNQLKIHKINTINDLQESTQIAYKCFSWIKLILHKINFVNVLHESTEITLNKLHKYFSWIHWYWIVALIGSPTQHPPLPEVTAKKIILLHLSLPSHPERWGPEEEREDIISSIFQAPMETCLEQTSDPGRWGELQWSIPSLPSIHIIPAQQPMRICPGLISRTRLITAGFISRPHQAGSRNPQNDLVETASPGHLPPSALSGSIETTSLGRPIGQQTKISLWLTLQEKLSHSHRAAATRSHTTRRPLHALPCLTWSLKWDSSLQKLPQPPASRVRTSLQWHLRSRVELQSPRRNSLNHTSALTRLASGSSFPHGVLRDRGLSHLPLLAVLESTSPPSGGGVSNGSTSLVSKWQKHWTLPLLPGSP